MSLLALHACTSNTNVCIGISLRMRAYFVLKMYCLVLHIGIYISIFYKKQRDTQVLCLFSTCKHDQTLYLIWYLHVESKHRTFVSLCYLYNIDIFQYVTQGSGGGRVVKLLACGARGPGFVSLPRHLNFRDWLSPASKSRYGWNTAKAT